MRYHVTCLWESGGVPRKCISGLSIIASHIQLSLNLRLSESVTMPLVSVM